MADAALSGVRVLDISTVLAAPVTATLLGDFGADVVKVEEPGKGDFSRATSSGYGGRSLQWLQEGRNKRSITLNLRSERGQDILRRLIPHFDVVITNYRPPTLKKWGIDPESMQKLHPQAVLLFVTGYGLTGPYSDRGAFDRIASAFSGLTYVSGEPERNPVRSGYAVIDFMAAYMAAYAVLTALYHRDVNGGTGQVIDLALYEAGFRASEDALLAYSVDGSVRERLGNRNPSIVPASDFDTADRRRISLHAGTDTLFRRLCAAMGTPDLATDRRFQSQMARVEHQDDLYAIIANWVSRFKADEVVELLTHHDIPASPIMSIADIAANAHYRERGTIVDVFDEEHGTVTMAAPLPHLNVTPGSIRTLGPPLGHSTDEILSNVLDYGQQELHELRIAGII